MKNLLLLLLLPLLIFSCSKKTIKQQAPIEQESTVEAQVSQELLDSDLETDDVDFTVGEMDDIDEIEEEIKVEDGSTNMVQQEQIYVVRTGDNLYEIAQAYGLKIWQIAVYNQIDNPDFILAGSKMRIPPQAFDPNKDADGVHYVDVGDTLSQIAQKYGVSITQLAQINNISNIDYIQAGSVLTIPSSP